MPQRISQILQTKLTGNRIVFIYFAVGAVWIILSSLYIASQSVDSDGILLLETFKGLGYVIVTSALLWFLCRRWSAELGSALSKYEKSETKYELYVKNSPIAISVIDRAGNFIEVNKATEELTGYDPEELKKMSILNLIVAHDLEDTKKSFGDIFIHGYATRDCAILGKDGSEKIIRADGVLHTEDQAICFSRDITDRKQNEKKLLMLNAMLRAIRRVNKAVVGTPDIDQLIQKICEILIEDREFKHAWIALLDNDEKLLHYHDAPKLKAADKLKCFLEEGKLPKCIESTKSEQGLILATHPIEQCPDFPIMEGMEDCALLGFEFKYDNSHGYIALMTSRQAVEDEEEIDLFREVAGDLQYALQNIKAESERKRATKDLIIAKQAAEKANQAKDEFLSVMSHELRTPLNPIMGHTSLLLQLVKDPTNVESLEQISHASERLLTLIDGILFFSELQEGSRAYQSAHFYLLECCESALTKCKNHCTEQKINFENGTGDYEAIDPDLLVGGVKEHIRRIVDELLSNACKYTHEGEIHLRVGQRDLGSGQMEALFEIEDNGIGIEEEVLDKLFAPFTQLDSSHTRRYEGIGLGLAICRKISDLVGGSLTAESQPEVGSTFRFRCKLEKSEPQTNPKHKAALKENANISSTGHVLVVEDNPSNALVAQTMLERWGLKVELAEHGKSALGMCENKHYELILMDLSMPVMNGLDATQEIRNSDTPNRETPIIGLTAHVSTDVKEDCLNAGMDAFITKPIRMKPFKECISKYVRITD